MLSRWGASICGLAAACGAASLLACRVAGAVTMDEVQPCEPIDPTMTAYNYNHDFNDPNSQLALRTVEINHFDADVRQLRKGETAPLPHDLDFVLRAFPNDYEALNAMASWQLANKGSAAARGYWTADCYFLRAISFRPNDWKVHYVYAIFLDKARRLPEAAEQYAIAEKDGGSGPDFYYNRGLFEVDAGNLEKARDYARKAREAGNTLPGLAQRIAQAERAGAAHSVTRQAPRARCTDRKSGNPAASC